ncbi:MAG: STT3 domain-containing protein, partial [Candidatus Bathyarchaeia archaeon]
AFGLRLLPIRWGYYLTEFDPYHQYRQTKYIVDNGFFAWVNWHDYMSWYPWGSRISSVSYPGLPMTAAILYMILNALGIRINQSPSLDPLLSDPVYNFAVIFPVFMATLTCFVMYFLGKDLGGEKVGLLASFLLALDSSYIGRTSLGWFDDETVGILGILLFILFFIRSIGTNKPLKTGLLYAIAAGLSLGYLTASWGASRYPIVMTALFALILLIIRRYSPRLLLSYVITFGLALFIAMNVPYLGFKFLFEESILPVYGVLALLCIAEINRRTKTFNKKLIYILIFIALIGAFYALLVLRGIIKPLESKFISVLNPSQRISLPLVESVAEHRPSAWGTFYYNFGIGIFFIPIGLFFATMMATDLSIFMIIYGLTSIYFASSMIRLTVLMSPALCLLWALALTRLLKPFTLFLKETTEAISRRMKFKPSIGKEVVGGILILMLVLFALTFVIGIDFLRGPNAQGPRVYSQAYAPATIAAASMPVKPDSTVTGWLDALCWMRNYLPPDAVVASWWDYGYWIRVIANRTTLVDNGTWNRTQIEQVALMFMSDVDNATDILKKYKVTHVVVFDTVLSSGYDWDYGEFGKFIWMIRIAGLNESSFGSNQYVQELQRNYWVWSDYGKNTTLYQMMVYGKYKTLGSSVDKVLEDYIESANRWRKFESTFKLVFPTQGYKSQAVSGLYPFVFIYEVNYQ